MKPAEAQERRVQMEQRRETVAGEEMAALMAGDPNLPVPLELLPGAQDLVDVHRALRKAVRRGNRMPRVGGREGGRRALLADMVVLLATLIYVERVTALDPLERAGLRVGRVVEMSSTTPEQIAARLARWQGESEMEV